MMGLPDTTAHATISTSNTDTADWVQSVVLGSPSDVVLDGDFSSGTNWPDAGTWVVGSGVATHTAGNASGLVQSGVLVIGNYYYIEYTVKTVTASYALVVAGTTVGAERSTVGRFGEVLQCAGSKNLTMATHADFAGTIDDVVAYDLGAAITDDYPTIDHIAYGYDASPTAGELIVAGDTGILYHLDVTATGPDFVNIDRGLYHTKNRPIIAFLTAAGAAVKGKLNVRSF